MAKLKGNFPRERITVTLDSEMLAIIRILKLKSGVSMSQTVESLMLLGLKNTKVEGN
jgi:hypothetical protein